MEQLDLEFKYDGGGTLMEGFEKGLGWPLHGAGNGQRGNRLGK